MNTKKKLSVTGNNELGRHGFTEVWQIIGGGRWYWRVAIAGASASGESRIREKAVAAVGRSVPIVAKRAVVIAKKNAEKSEAYAKKLAAELAGWCEP